MHIDEVIDRISSYSASISKPVSVIELGKKSMPNAPYVVVSQEPGLIRVNTHYPAGHPEELREYVRVDLDKALNRVSLTTCELIGDNIPAAIIGSNDDGTISQERVFTMPDGM